MYVVSGAPHNCASSYGISIGSSVFARFTVVPNTQTDTHTHTQTTERAISVAALSRVYAMHAMCGLVIHVVDESVW